MERPSAAISSTSELTINEKLLRFKQKKDESRKENDVPPNKNTAAAKGPTTAPNVLQSNSNLMKPLESKRNVSKLSKSTCPQVLVQSAPVFSLKPKKEITVFCTKAVALQAEPKGRVLRAKTRCPTSSEFKSKLDEYVMLAENAGIEVGRSFISTVPSEMNMKDVETQALYWLTWIRHEGDAEQWEFVISLFVRAKNSVKSLSGVQAILTAEQKLSHLLMPTEPLISVDVTESYESITCCENSNLLDTSIRNDADDVDCNDVRLMMGEDGFALGELSHPKALRFSIGDSTEQQTHQMIESITKPPTPLPNIMQSPGRIPIGKYAGFIQSTQRPHLSTQSVSVTCTTKINSSIAAISPLKLIPRTVSSHIAELEDRLKVKAVEDTHHIMAQPSSLPAKLLQAFSFSPYGHKSNRQNMSSRRSFGGKFEKIKSPGDATLDALLGIGMYEDDADDEVNAIIPLDSSAKLTSISTRKNRSSTKSSEVTSSISSCQVGGPRSDTDVVVDIPLIAERGEGKEGKDVRRVNIGAEDIFSDDEDDHTGREVITELNYKIGGSIDTRNRKRALEFAAQDEEVVITNINCTITSSSETSSNSIPTQPYKKRATVNRAAVSFAVEVLSTSPKIVKRTIDEEFDSVMIALTNTVLDSGCRRSRRLSGPTGIILSCDAQIKKKFVRKGTPHAANRPPFSRPSPRDSTGSKGSENSTGRSSDYGSYFSSMEESPQFGEIDDIEFSLLAATPVFKERRSRRLSSSKR